MAYEVIKTIRGRPYRYSVESYRDPETGKVRARWTYVGRGDIHGARSRPPRRSSETTRTRLIDALERLLEREPYAKVTAGAIATEAGLAHGTFYRQFRDKRDALEAGFERVREALALERRALAEALADGACERKRFAAWARRSCTHASHRGLYRAWYSLASDDPELLAARRRRRDEVIGEIFTYLERLAAAGYIGASSILTAQIITITIEGAIRRVYIDGDTLQPETIDALAAMLTGTVFGPP